MHTVSILCSAADAVSSGSWFILFKVLISSVTMHTVLLHLNNFSLGLGLGFVVDFRTLGSGFQPQRKAPLVFPREGQCGLDIWFELELS